MAEFTPSEEDILNTLYAAEKPLTTQRVADDAGIAWKTAKKYLLKLREQGFVEAGKYGKSTYWWLET